MRVTVVSYGSEGDVRPVLALGIGLIGSGHEVVLVSDARRAEDAEEHGFEFYALDTGLLDRTLDSLDPGIALRNFTGWPYAEWLQTSVLAAAGSDLVIGLPPISYAAAAAADQVGAVGVLAGLQPLLPTRAFPPSALGAPRMPHWLNRPVGQLIDAVAWAGLSRGLNRARSGLPPSSNPYHSLPYLGGWSPALVPTPEDWDSSRVMVTGHWSLPRAEGFVPPEEILAFLDAGDRPIYVGFGSMRGAKVTYAVEQALKAYATDYRILLASPWPGELPDNVLRIGPTPHDWLFPKCGALVHHCGAGTAHAAAGSGIPSIPVPFGFDQPFWADRLYRLGVASKPVDPRSGWEAYEKPLRATVAAREPASDLAVRVNAEDGVAAAVSTLELLATKRP